MAEQQDLHQLVESMTGEPLWKVMTWSQIDEPLRSALLEFACCPFTPNEGVAVAHFLGRLTLSKKDLARLCQGYESLPADRRAPGMSEREFIGQILGQNAKRIDPEWVYSTLKADLSGTGVGLMMHLWRSPMSRERKVELVRRALRECRFDTFGAIVTARRGRLHEVCPDLAAYAASPDNPRELRREARAAVAKLQASVPGADTQ